jgi:hypothetical protein
LRLRAFVYPFAPFKQKGAIHACRRPLLNFLKDLGKISIQLIHIPDENGIAVEMD